MGKGATSLTNSLYKINDTIAQSTVKTPVPEPQDAPVQETKNTEEIRTPSVKKEVSPERIIEFNRMRHDLEIRVEGMAAEYQSEIGILEARLRELNQSGEQMEKFRQELKEITLPDESEADPGKYISRQLRALEVMRLETIRLNKKMDASKGNGTAYSPAQNQNINLMDIPNGDIMKKGFAFFFPLALALFFCTILMALAFILAWKVVI